MGKIYVGNRRNEETNEETPVYLSDEATTTCIIGKQGSGKSELQINFAKDIINCSEGLICIDFVRNSELSTRIESITPENKLLVVKLSSSNKVVNQVDVLELAEAIESRKVILFKIPQLSFSSTNERDEVVTEVFDYIVEATEIAQHGSKEILHTHLIIDDLYSCKVCLSKLINECVTLQERLSGLRLYISCMSVEQFKDLFAVKDFVKSNYVISIGDGSLNNQESEKLKRYSAIITVEGESKPTQMIVELPTPVISR